MTMTFEHEQSRLLPNHVRAAKTVDVCWHVLTRYSGLARRILFARGAYMTLVFILTERVHPSL